MNESALFPAPFPDLPGSQRGKSAGRARAPGGQPARRAARAAGSERERRLRSGVWAVDFGQVQLDGERGSTLGQLLRVSYAPPTPDPRLLPGSNSYGAAQQAALPGRKSSESDGDRYRQRMKL